MTLPTNWWDVLFIACLPLIFLVLIFSWLTYVSRGRRSLSVVMTGFGISLAIGSTHGPSEASAAGIAQADSESRP